MSSTEADIDPGVQVWSSSEGQRVWREAWAYRELFFFLAWRDIKIRYKQTVLGVLWAILQPLLTMIVFTILFSRIARLPSDGVPAPLFYLSGLLPWLYFSTTLNSVGMSLISNTNLLTKVYFPRMILPASAAISGLLDFCIGSLLLVIVCIYYGTGVSWMLLMWPALIVLLFVLSLGIGSFVAALNVRFRDVKYALPFAIQLWLFVTPVIYPTSMVPERFQWLLVLNPLGAIIEAMRASLVPVTSFSWDRLGVAVAVTVVYAVVGFAYFRKTERAFADVV